MFSNFEIPFCMEIFSENSAHLLFLKGIPIGMPVLNFAASSSLVVDIKRNAQSEVHWKH